MSKRRHDRISWGSSRLLAFVFCWLVWPVQAQYFQYDVIYRPPSAEYLLLRTPHFDVIYEAGYSSEAVEAAAIMEQHLSEIQALTGHQRTVRIPLIINGYTDNANGFVQVFPFKQEIIAHPLKTDGLSPGHENWLYTVLPHEMTHALHADGGKGFGLGAVLRPFVPDIVRSFNLFIPRGISEGIAVFQESRESAAGRLNHSLFTMRFRAAMGSRHPWSLAQLVEPPVFTWPVDRFYLGGAHLVEYLARDEEIPFFERAANMQYRIPFLGYGVPFWYGTRTWPRKVWRAFRDSVQTAEVSRLAHLQPMQELHFLTSQPGAWFRNPTWISDDALVAHGRAYHSRPGFFSIDMSHNAIRPIRTSAITEDFAFSVYDGQAVYARYDPHPFSPEVNLTQIYGVDLATGSEARLTSVPSLYRPAYHAGLLRGIRHTGLQTSLVTINTAGKEVESLSWDGVRIIDYVWDEGHDSFIILAAHAGRQALYRVGTDTRGAHQLEGVFEFENAFVLDLDWGIPGESLLFGADPGGVANIFLFNLEQRRLYQLTDVPYGAQEPALSPDGQTLAFVHYAHERYDIVTQPFRLDRAAPIDEGWRQPALLQHEEHPQLIEESPSNQTYRALKYLKPRLFYPVAAYEFDNGGEASTLGLGLGAGIQGSDPLQRLVYRLEGLYQADRLWMEAGFQIGKFLLQPELRVFRRPDAVNALVSDPDGSIVDMIRVGRLRQGAELRARLPVRIERNVYQTGLTLTLTAGYLGSHLFEPGGEMLTDWQRATILNPSLFYYHRLHRNVRELQPSSGFTLSLLSEITLQTTGDPAHALLSRFRYYLPTLPWSRSQFALDARLVSQNAGGIYNLSNMLPRGLEDQFLGKGNFPILGLEVLQPFLFVDDGLFMIPAYLGAVYGYGFVESLFVQNNTQTVAGLGVGVRARLWYLFNVDLRIGAGYHLTDNRWSLITR